MKQWRKWGFRKQEEGKVASHRSGDACREISLWLGLQNRKYFSPELESGPYDDHSRTKEHAANKILLHTRIHTHTKKKIYNWQINSKYKCSTTLETNSSP